MTAVSAIPSTACDEASLTSIDPTEINLRLDAAVARRNAPKLSRFAESPAKSVTTVLLRATGATRIVSATTFWGEKMQVVLPEPVSAMIYRFGFYDEAVCRFLIASLRPGNVFADVGAHFGFFSKLGANLVGSEGRVVAFEPMPRTNARLRTNLDRPLAVNVATVLEVAAFDETRQLEFRDFGEAHSSFNSAFLGRGVADQGTRVNVSARRFDDVWAELGAPKLDCVKIDAESAEINVLRGMEGTLSAARPNVIAEFGDFDLPNVPPSRQTVSWLLDRGYVAFEWSGNNLVRHELLDRYPYVNLMFVPTERAPG
jgi:FkbM family methyltransferase